MRNPACQRLLAGDPYAVGTFRDAWSCKFENIQSGVIGEVKHPILDDWSKLVDLRPSFEALEFDIAEVNSTCAA